MAMRITGMNSGLDTETIIQELVAAKRTKVDDAKKAQTKLGWKTDVWKDLNSKLKSLQSKYLMNMRFEDAYSKKTTTVSNSSAASVITGDNAMIGSQKLEVTQLAKTAYMTGAKMNYQGSEELTALSKLSDLTGDMTGEGSLSIKAGDETVDIKVTADTTISDVLTKLKEAGLNANFDEKQQRLFIGAKESGKANDFEITAADAEGQKALKALGLEVQGTNGWDADGNPIEGSAMKVAGQDAQIVLNGAVFESSSNVFEINGLTITALAETKGEEVTISTQTDTSGIYDMIKDFLKEYNTIINQIDKLYNADSAKGYEPLTNDEKDAMSESEIEEWEKKIKDSLLRRDSNLSTIGSALKEIMASGIEVNGKKMYLSDFGIETLGYFKSADNEKNAYHIAGDKDDEATSADADKLLGMITSDPDTVVSFFSSLSKALYAKMDDLSSSVEGYRSFGNFYDDTKMKTDYDDYKTKISDLEKKLTDYEDKWYAKFSAMETALAKLQSNASAVTSLLGGS